MPAEAISAEPGDERALEAMAEADRTLRMARVLAAGGFPEETPRLLAQSLRSMAAALSAKRGESLADSGADGNIRSLVEKAALPVEALAILEAANQGALSNGAIGAEQLIAATTRILASVRRNEPSLSALAMTSTSFGVASGRRSAPQAPIRLNLRCPAWTALAVALQRRPKRRSTRLSSRQASPRLSILRKTA